jgi:simple sugar transport system permease protein
VSLALDVGTGAVRGGTSILFAGLGETIAERAGIVNLGTEGSMLVGALGAYALAVETGSPVVGALGGAACGAVLASVFAYFVVTRRANQLATGLIVMFLALGLTSLFGADYVSRQAPLLSAWNMPGLADIPWIGQIFFRADPLTYCSYLLVPLAWWVLFRSRWGLLLRGTGERRAVVATCGHHPDRIQYVAVVVGGALAGLGGAQLSLAYAQSWFENLSAGRGFVAVALVIFASRRPIRVAGGSYLFGAALALSPALQARGVGINQFALDALPYLVTLAVLLLVAKRQLEDTPEGLAEVFQLVPDTS